MHDIRTDAPPAVPSAIQIKRPQIAKDRPLSGAGRPGRRAKGRGGRSPTGTRAEYWYFGYVSSMVACRAIGSHHWLWQEVFAVTVTTTGY